MNQSSGENNAVILMLVLVTSVYREVLVFGRKEDFKHVLNRNFEESCHFIDEVGELKQIGNSQLVGSIFDFVLQVKIEHLVYRYIGLYSIGTKVTADISVSLGKKGEVIERIKLVSNRENYMLVSIGS